MSAVVEVITSLERGGAQRLALEAAARLHAADRPVYLVTGAPAALDEEARERLGPRLLRAPTLANPVRPLHDVRALLAVARHVERVRRGNGPVVVHTHSSKAGVLGRLAGRSVQGARVVHTVHGFGLDALGPRGRPWLLAAERIATAATDVLLFVSDADRRTADALELSSSARRFVVPAACDADRWTALDVDEDARARARDALGIDRGATLALTIANLKPQKDPLFHVEVLAAWRRRVPRAELLFLGDGPLRSAALRRADELGVAQALHLPGFVLDPAPALAAADVVLLASRWEGLPLSVLEALASGLACVVRDAGWAGELSFAGERLAALPPFAAPEDFADRLERLAALPRTKLALPRRFTWAGYLEALDRLYDELLGR